MVLAGQKGLLALLVGVWAYYHVIRQHYGFLVLYKVKNRDLLPLDNKLDRALPRRDDDLPALPSLLHSPPRGTRHQARVPAIRAACSGSIVAATAVAWLARQWRRFPDRSSQVPAVRRHHSAALADLRVHELAGRRAHRDHRAQPAVSRAGLVSQSQPLCGRDGC